MLPFSLLLYTLVIILPFICWKFTVLHLRAHIVDIMLWCAKTALNSVRKMSEQTFVDGSTVLAQALKTQVRNH